jgi:predicted ATPase
MSFSFMNTTPPRKDGAEQRAKVAAAELAQRAALLFRLGYSEAATTKRLCERIAWELEGNRPESLNDKAIGKIVTDTYARRPK